MASCGNSIGLLADFCAMVGGNIDVSSTTPGSCGFLDAV